jgi:DNA-binding NarL/FixJ family response regulator
LRALLELHDGWEVCGEAESGEEAVKMASDLSPDIVLMDVSMPGIGGLEATRIIAKTSPKTKIVLVTFHKSVELIRAGLSVGASGYILKADPETIIVEALESVSQNRIFITPSIDPGAAAKVLKEMNISATGSSRPARQAMD